MLSAIVPSICPLPYGTVMNDGMWQMNEFGSAQVLEDTIKLVQHLKDGICVDLISLFKKDIFKVGSGDFRLDRYCEHSTCNA